MFTKRLFLILAPLAVLALAATACDGDIDQSRIDAAVAAAIADQDQDSNRVSDRIRARSFELVDNSDNLVGSLSPTGPGVGLTLRDAAGVGRLLLALDERGSPSVTLLDETGTRRVGLEFNPNGNPSLFLRDEQGILKAGLQIQADGGPLLFFRSAERQDSLALTLLEGDEPVLSMASPDGNSRVLFGLESPDFNPLLLFRAGDGAPLLELP